MICLIDSHVRFRVMGSCANAFQKLLIQSTFRVAMMSSYTARTSGLASLYSINPKIAMKPPEAHQHLSNLRLNVASSARTSVSYGNKSYIPIIRDDSHARLIASLAAALDGYVPAGDRHCSQEICRHAEIQHSGHRPWQGSSPSHSAGNTRRSAANPDGSAAGK